MRSWALSSVAMRWPVQLASVAAFLFALAWGGDTWFDALRTAAVVNYANTVALRMELLSLDNCSGDRAPGSLVRLQTLISGLGASDMTQVLEARLQALTGDCAGARAAWARLLAQGVRHPMVLLQTIQDGKDFSGLEPEDRSRLGRFAFLKAAQLHREGDYEAARIWYQRAFQLAPSWRIARSLAGLYVAMGQVEATETVWNTLLRLSPPDTEDHWWAQGELAGARMEWPSAARAFEEGARYARTPFDFLLRAGDMWRAAGRYEEAREAYLRAHRARPENGSPFLALGDLEFARERYRIAIDWYREALARQPDTPAYLYAIARTYYRLGETTLAREYLTAALERAPQHSWSLFLAAQLSADEGDIASALSLAVQALEVYPRSAKPTLWVQQATEWLLRQRSCGDAERLLRLLGADPVAEKVAQFYETTCSE